MIIQCIDNKDVEESLTLNSKYMAVESGNQYLVNADDGIGYFNKSRFEVVE